MEHRYESDPRYVLKKVMEDAKEMGYEFNVGPECEFFLFHTDDDGYADHACHMRVPDILISGPLDFGENARRDMVLTLEDMGFEIEASHHEAAPAQHEIDFRYDEALTTADNIMTFKLVVKTIAKTSWAACNIYAKTEIRDQWFRYASEHVYLAETESMYSRIAMMKMDLAKRHITSSAEL